MDTNERPMCVSCLAEGRERPLTDKEVEGCKRHSISWNCSVHVSQMVALRLKEKKNAERATTKKQALQKKATEEKKADDEMYAKELEVFLGVRRSLIDNYLFEGGLLPFRKLNDYLSRIVVKVEDVEELLSAVRDDDPRIPHRVRLAIKIGCASYHD